MSKGEAGTGNIVEAVRHARAVTSEIRRITTLGAEELMSTAKVMGAPHDLVCWVKENGRLPVVNFAAGGVATPADAALMMQLGVDGVFVGSGIFKSEQPDVMAKAVVEATTNFADPDILVKVSRGLGRSMAGLEIGGLEPTFADRGW